MAPLPLPFEGNTMTDNQFIHVKEISLLHMRPGDALLVKMSDARNYAPRQLENFRDKLMEIFPNNPVIITSANDEFQIIRKENYIKEIKDV